MSTTTPDTEILWNAILNRDPRFDGAVYYGVTTTGIYCKPTCPSRRPARANALLFPDGASAVRAGFRPCKRCRPYLLMDPDGDVGRVRRAIQLIVARGSEAPTLGELGGHVGLSAQHIQRLFKATLGVSPHQYGAALRMARFKQQVRAGEPIAGAAYDAGFGSSSRLYERAGAYLGMTPGRYKKQGAGMTIRQAGRETALGWLLVAATDHGLCSVQLGDDREEMLAVLRADFARATLAHDPHGLQPWLDAFAAYLDGHARLPAFPLDVQATAFQARVWQALRKVPYGTTVTYSELAEAMGAPQSTRAVASACAKNPVALTVPCHRVVPRSGGVGGYRWDPARKKRLLEIERLG